MFVVSAVALAALATLIGQGTDELGERFGPATTGILQSALGNLPELFISIFALQAGLVVVGVTDMEARIEESMHRADKLQKKQLKADMKALERDAQDASGQ